MYKHHHVNVFSGGDLTFTSLSNQEPEVGTLWLATGSRTSLAFGLKSCKNAQIGLVYIPGIHLGYQIIIGDGNSVSYILKEGTRVAETQTPGILDCNERRFFWVRWENGHFEVGADFLAGLGRFLDWKDDSFNVFTALSFSSGSDETAEWFLVMSRGMF